MLPYLQLKLENVKKLIRRNAKGPLQKLLTKLHPADIAYIISNLNDIDKKKLLTAFKDLDSMGQILLRLKESDIIEILSNTDPKMAGEMIMDMEIDDATYILRVLPDELKEKILQFATPSEITEVEELLHYPEDAAGSVMNTEYIAFKETVTVKEATKLIHKSTDVEMVYYVYVIDEEERLTGVLSLRQLILNPPEKLLSDIMTKDVVYVLDTSNKDYVASMVEKYDFLALPVLDSNLRMMGIITFDDVIDIIRDEATETIYKMSGTSQEALDNEDSVLIGARARLPWLVITLFGEMLAGFVTASFQNKIIEFAVISSFMPVIMAMGGNVGGQSSAIIIRNIATGNIDVRSKMFPVLWKELRVGLLMGLVVSIPVYFIAPIVHPGNKIGIIVALALFVAMSFAAFSGTFVPLIMTKLKVDPAIASGPFISTFNDITGLTIYFTIAMSLLSLT